MVGPEWWIHTLRAIRHLNAYPVLMAPGTPGAGAVAVTRREALVLLADLQHARD
jgi:hypothetical protein